MRIVDNGIGMTQKEINDRYLQVGYERREDEDNKHGAVSRSDGLRVTLPEPAMGIEA